MLAFSPVTWIHRVGEIMVMAIIKTKTDEPIHLLLLFAGIAALLFTTSVVAHVMGWLPNAATTAGNTIAVEGITAASAKSIFIPASSTPSPVLGPLAGKRRCPECGVITAMREIEMSGKVSGLGAPNREAAGSANMMRMNPAKLYEFTVRLDDGTHRVIIDTHRAAWRLGERLNIIDGINPSSS